VIGRGDCTVAGDRRRSPSAIVGAQRADRPYPRSEGPASGVDPHAAKPPAGDVPAMLLWLVGYPEKPTTRWGADAAAFQGYLQQEAGEFKNERGRKGFIHTYVWKGQMACGGSDQWKTYSRREKPFRPTKERPNVRWVRVMLYPFWPPANYYVDNVKLVEVDPAYDAAQSAKEDAEREARLKANKAKRDAEDK
jgi:hypothetical protein